VGVNWERIEHLSAHQRLEVLALLDQKVAELQREAIDEGRRRVVVHGWPGVHWLAHDGGRLFAYAQLSGNDPASVEMAGGGFDPELFSLIQREAPVIEWWIRDGASAGVGGRRVRTLHFLEVELPIEVVAVPSGVTMRTFEPGRDNAAWLEQNNSAFAEHPEQGAWRHEDLEMRLAEPWFDPSGFLVFEREGRIVASCWTKVHELHTERFGEIYVISVHPSAQGSGLGRVAVTQGLDLLRRKGVARAALFVDDSNTGARALYGALGFREVRADHLVLFDSRP
jgi:mycothiol synthase